MDKQRTAEATSHRVHALDGLRGALACVVMLKHATEHGGHGPMWLHIASQAAVVCFFAISGYVLTRSWDGRFGLFLARRFVRLWPVYALTLAAGYVIAGLPPEPTQFFWYPVLLPAQGPEINVPIWSLRIEAWAMLFMPFFVWSSRSPRRLAVALIAVGIAAHLYTKLFFGLFFICGAFASRWTFRNRWLESAPAQFVGRISYSLYLSHWLVFALARRALGENGPIAAIPLACLVGWLIWRFVEAPTTRLSQHIAEIWPTRLRLPEISLRSQI